MMKSPHPPVNVLWCANRRHRAGNGWSFPPAVEYQLRELTRDQTVCHLFGGLARFGLRCDIDPQTKPHIIADAWLPPFQRDAFDTVILDAPYIRLNQQEKSQLLRGAAYIARRQVIWFHTIWLANGGSDGLRLERSWLVRVGDMCAVRCLQVFAVRVEAKILPRPYFTRGPAMRYNRWLAGQQRLELEAAQ
jgi:hypothetical protein